MRIIVCTNSIFIPFIFITEKRNRLLNEITYIGTLVFKYEFAHVCFSTYKIICNKFIHASKRYFIAFNSDGNFALMLPQMSKFIYARYWKLYKRYYYEINLSVNLLKTTSTQHTQQRKTLHFSIKKIIPIKSVLHCIRDSRVHRTIVIIIWTDRSVGLAPFRFTPETNFNNASVEKHESDLATVCNVTNG